MASGPVVSLIYLGAFILGPLSLVLSMIGIGWFVVNPKETGQSLLRGKRGLMFALCVVAVPVATVCGIAFLALVFAS